MLPLKKSILIMLVRRFLHTDRTWNNHQIISATSIPNSPIDQCSSSGAPCPFPFLLALKSEDNIDGSNDKILSSPSPSYSSSSSHSFATVDNTTILMPLLSSPMLRERQPLQQQLGSTYNHTPLTSPVIKANGMPTSHRVFSNHNGMLNYDMLTRSHYGMLNLNIIIIY